jgi:hypothetical protein
MSRAGERPRIRLDVEVAGGRKRPPAFNAFESAQAILAPRGDIRAPKASGVAAGLPKAAAAGFQAIVKPGWNKA